VAKLPWEAWYASDWLSDEKLRLCSFGAKGLWMDLLCIMLKSDTKGMLVNPEGKPMTAQEIASLTGGPEGEIFALLEELKRRKVCSQNEDGILYSRRLKRNSELSAVRSKAGRKGGLRSKNLLKQNMRQNGQQTGQQTHKQTLVCGMSDLEGDVGEKKQGENLAEISDSKDLAKFWEAYPKPMHKTSTDQWWRSLRIPKASLPMLFDNLEKWKASEEWQREGGRYIPSPANWLKEGSWQHPPKKTGLNPTRSESNDAMRQWEEIEAERKKQ
jgi:hypothetical protein